MRRIATVVAGCVVAAWLPAGHATESVDIREWPVPWDESRPRDPFVDSAGIVWFVGQRGHYVANFDPQTEDFTRYDLDEGTGPHNLIVAGEGDEAVVWYAGNLQTHVGRLDPATGSIEKIMMPLERARDPHTLIFDESGDIWFTVQGGNFVGHLDTATSEASLIDVPTPRARPYGIKLNSRNQPWVVAFGTNKLLRIDRQRMSLEEIELPHAESRPRRIVITSDDKVWYGDFALGRLGRYDPADGSFTEWDLPSGAASEPYGMAVDNRDRVWVVETGVQPNQFVGFDTATESVVSITEVPSGGGRIRHMHYDESSGTIWFGTDTNNIGRARVH